MTLPVPPVLPDAVKAESDEVPYLLKRIGDWGAAAEDAYGEYQSLVTAIRSIESGQNPATVKTTKDGVTTRGEITVYGVPVDIADVDPAHLKGLLILMIPAANKLGYKILDCTKQLSIRAARLEEVVRAACGAPVPVVSRPHG